MLIQIKKATCAQCAATFQILRTVLRPSTATAEAGQIRKRGRTSKAISQISATRAFRRFRAKWLAEMTKNDKQGNQERHRWDPSFDSAK
jgi:hypothetical protein